MMKTNQKQTGPPEHEARMNKVVFTCEVVTPMFLSGSKQETCEWRVPSLRGALRYWLRALLGGQGLSLKTVAAEEAEVFGNTQKGSLVRLRIHEIGKAEKGRAEQLLDRLDQGARYLWYSTTLGSNDRGYFKPGSYFQVVFSALPPHTEALERAVGAFWLLAHCGGLGTRSRRAAGSFRAALKERRGDHLRIPDFTSSNGFEGYFDNQLRLVRELMPQGQAVECRPSFDSLYPSFAKIWRANLAEKSWQDAVAAIGQKFQTFRERRPPDYQAVKDFLDLSQSSAPDTVERASFGLPLTFRYRSLNWKSAIVNPANHDRRASPLWMRIIRLPNGDYDTMLTYFDSTFLPPGERLKINRASMGTPTNSLVPTFVEECLPECKLLFP